MAKYLISGYDYQQVMALKPDTYTIVVHVKSMFSDEYQFSLFNGEDWELFNIPTKKGEWCWLPLTFTTTDFKTRLRPIVEGNYDAEHPVYVTMLQIIKGNEAVDAGKSPFDIDQIIDDLHDYVGHIADFTDEEFADRILSADERVSLKHDLDTLETIFQSLKGSYEQLLINPFISASALTDLQTKYADVVSKKALLFTVIEGIITGNDIISDDEILAKDSALSQLNIALYNYNKAEKEIYNDLGEDYTQKISELEDFTVGPFADGQLSDMEKISLSHDLDHVNMLIEGLTASYEVLLNNPYLDITSKQLLEYKFVALLNAWERDNDLVLPDGLRIVILDIINDDENVTQDEIDEKDLALSAFNQALSEYSTTETTLQNLAVELAIDMASYWSIQSTSPIIYKNAPDAETLGTHLPVTVTGELRAGDSVVTGGFLSVTPNGGTESSATPSPKTISPTVSEGKLWYTVKLYDSPAKTVLLDLLTIPVVFSGMRGLNAINITLTNEFDGLPCNPDGGNVVYTASENSLRVFEGATELEYDGLGLNSGKYNVTAIGDSITPGSKTKVGLTCAFGTLSDMLAAIAKITYTITGRTLEGESFSFNKYHTIKKMPKGADGTDGHSPYIGTNGNWYFWDYDLGDFKDSSLSAEGDDGHSPYVNPTTLTWMEWNAATGEYEDTEIIANAKDGEDGFSVSMTTPVIVYPVTAAGALKGQLSDGQTAVEVLYGGSAFTCPSTTTAAPTENDTYKVTVRTQTGITSNVAIVGSQYVITPATFNSAEGKITLTIVARINGINRSFIRIIAYKKIADGANGTSITILGKKTSPNLLPSSASVGDAYTIDGDLWIYDGVTQESGATFGWQNAGNIQGENAYLHMAWADTITFSGTTPISQTGFTDVDTANKAWFGVYTDNIESDAGADDFDMYKWVNTAGLDGYTVQITPQMYTYPVLSNGVLKGALTDGTIKVEVMSGNTVLTCPDTTTATPVTDNTYRITSITPSTGLTVSKSVVSNQFTIWPATFSPDNGLLTIVITARRRGVNTNFTRVISYDKVYDGADAEGHSPYVGEDGYWYQWDVLLGMYVTTGVKPKGADGVIIYPDGYYDSTRTYVRTETAAPYVQLLDTLFLLIKPGNTSNVTPGPSTTDTWRAFDSFNEIFVTSLVAKFANIGGAIFTGNTPPSIAANIDSRLISRKGRDGTYNVTSYTGDAGSWQPMIMIDFERGKIRASDVEISGKIEGLTGRIGGFYISGDTLTNISSTGEYSSVAMIYFKDVARKTIAAIGGNVLPGQSGLTAVAYFQNDEGDNTRPNYALIVAASGGERFDNQAIYIQRGCVAGLSIKVRQVSISTTLSPVDVYISAYNTSTINLYFPSNPEVGKIYFIRKMNNSQIVFYGSTTNKISTGYSEVVSMTPEGGAGDLHVFVYDGQFWNYNFMYRKSS